jgi:uncharacterized protein
MLLHNEEIIQLHKEFAPSESVCDMVFQHGQIVYEIAQQLVASRKLVLEHELVRAGCLLHDIGAYAFIDAQGVFDETNYIRHGVVGAQMLRSKGLPEVLCRIAERHTGVGITAEEIRRTGLPLPEQDFTAESLEERLVMYADKFHSKPPRFNSFAQYVAHAAKFGQENQNRFLALAKEFGVPNLVPLSKKYNQAIL